MQSIKMDFNRKTVSLSSKDMVMRERMHKIRKAYVLIPVSIIK